MPLIKAETKIINKLQEIHELHPDLTSAGCIQVLLDAQTSSYRAAIEKLHKRFLIKYMKDNENWESPLVESIPEGAVHVVELQDGYNEALYDVLELLGDTK